MSDLFGAQKHQIKPKSADVTGEALQKLKHQVDQAARGNVDPATVRRRLEKAYQEELHKYIWPGAGDVPGRKLIRIVWRQGDGHPVRLYWDYLPHPIPTLLGACPKCYIIAPSQVDTKQATQPTIIDGYLARIPGNPEADKKLVPFSLSAPTFHITVATVNGKDMLTVRETIRCPEFHRCGWAVRVEDSIATQVSTRISTGKKGGGITGPLIKVK